MSDITDQPRIFSLVRYEDETGISGVGTVAQGVVFTDGTCAMRWNTATASTAVYDSLDDLVLIHGHGGRTQVEFIASGGDAHRKGEACTATPPTVTRPGDGGSDGLHREGHRRDPQAGRPGLLHGLGRWFPRRKKHNRHGQTV